MVSLNVEVFAIKVVNLGRSNEMNEKNKTGENDRRC